MLYGTIRSKFSIKICVKYRKPFFDSCIWTFYSDLKHNSHKKNNLLLSLKHIKSQMSYRTEKEYNNSKLNFVVVFLWMYKCYIKEKIPWIGTNYKHYFRIEITLFTITFFEWLQKKKKKQTGRMSYGTCRMGHFVWVRSLLILLHETNIKSFLEEKWTVWASF